MDAALQQFLRWDSHQTHLQTMFTHQLEKGRFCDITLACQGGQTIRAHRSVLCACSGYFDSVLSNVTDKETLVIMKDCRIDEIKLLIEFMYNGEICVEVVSIRKISFFAISYFPEIFLSTPLSLLIIAEPA